MSSNPQPAKRTVEDLIRDMEGLGDAFDPSPAVEFLRKRAGDKTSPDHVMADIMEGLWDEVQRLRRTLNWSKRGPKFLPKTRRRK